jgi:hypothetical protein
MAAARPSTSSQITSPAATCASEWLTEEGIHTQAQSLPAAESAAAVGAAAATVLIDAGRWPASPTSWLSFLLPPPPSEPTCHPRGSAGTYAAYDHLHCCSATASVADLHAPIAMLLPPAGTARSTSSSVSRPSSAGHSKSWRACCTCTHTTLPSFTGTSSVTTSWSTAPAGRSRLLTWGWPAASGDCLWWARQVCTDGFPAAFHSGAVLGC